MITSIAMLTGLAAAAVLYALHAPYVLVAFAVPAGALITSFAIALVLFGRRQPDTLVRDADLVAAWEIALNADLLARLRRKHKPWVTHLALDAGDCITTISRLRDGARGSEGGFAALHSFAKAEAEATVQLRDALTLLVALSRSTTRNTASAREALAGARDRYSRLYKP